MEQTVDGEIKGIIFLLFSTDCNGVLRIATEFYGVCYCLSVILSFFYVVSAVSFDTAPCRLTWRTPEE